MKEGIIFISDLQYSAQRFFRRRISIYSMHMIHSLPLLFDLLYRDLNQREVKHLEYRHGQEFGHACLSSDCWPQCESGSSWRDWNFGAGKKARLPAPSTLSPRPSRICSMCMFGWQVEKKSPWSSISKLIPTAYFSILGSCFFNLPAALLAAAWWHPASLLL